MRINNKVYIRTNAILIGIVIALCVGLVILSACVLMQATGESFYILCITISIIVLSLLILGLVIFTIKTALRKPNEKIRTLLKQFKGEGGFTHHFSGEIPEIAAALDEMMSELYSLLQSVQIKAQAIDRDMEILAKGIHQVAADQTNLFSLSAAIESVRSQQSGFSVISGEILSLVERTGHLTNDVRSMTSQLRAGISEIIVELEQVLRRVDPNRAGAPASTSANAENTDTPR